MMNKAEKFVIKDAGGNYMCGEGMGHHKWCDWSTDIGDALLFDKKMHAEGAVLFYKGTHEGFKPPCEPYEVKSVIIMDKVVETQKTLFGDES